MTTVSSALVMVSVMALSLFAGGPVRYMDKNSLTLEYTGMLRSQEITAASVPSHERGQFMTISYAPIEYVRLEAGVGGHRLSVDTYNGRQFEGAYGVSPLAGIALFTPALADIVRLTGGLDMIYMNSREGDYRYSGPVLNPFWGLLFHVGRYVDLEAGGRAHLISGTMENTETGANSAFSNQEIARGYMSFSLVSPEGAYARFHFDASPAINEEWNAGFGEATLGVSVGVTLKDRNAMTRKLDKKAFSYFPEYDSLQARQDRMARELEE